jgi:hypothetical protein
LGLGGGADGSGGLVGEAGDFGRDVRGVGGEVGNSGEGGEGRGGESEAHGGLFWELKSEGFGENEGNEIVRDRRVI